MKKRIHKSLNSMLYSVYKPSASSSRHSNLTNQTSSTTAQSGSTTLQLPVLVPQSTKDFWAEAAEQQRKYLTGQTMR